MSIQSARCYVTLRSRQPAQLDDSPFLPKLQIRFQQPTSDISRGLGNAPRSIRSEAIAIPTPPLQSHQARRPHELDQEALSQTPPKRSAGSFIPKRKLLFQPDLQFLLFFSLNTDKMREGEVASWFILRFLQG